MFGAVRDLPSSKSITKVLNCFLEKEDSGISWGGGNRRFSSRPYCGGQDLEALSKIFSVVQVLISPTPKPSNNEVNGI